jgi:DTW domain-containing protein YfiP
VSSDPAPVPQARPICPRCRRPTPTCYCAHLVPQATRTRVVVLQHPREERTAIGTARMAHLALTGSVLRVGLDFSADPVVNGALAERPDRYVLFPGPGAVPIEALPREHPITLVVLDGTWWQAKKLLNLNPQLAALPRVGFSPAQPSDYRIRRQPAEFCVSTIEALAEVLGKLEHDPARFATLLLPFRAMVDAQLRYADEVSARRHSLRDRRPRKLRRPPLADRLAAIAPRLVYAYGDANGWPVRHPDWRPAELVHWIAERATGERLELVLAPRNPLGPNTAQHVELDEARLRSGLSVEEATRRWLAFLRPDDVLVHYGPFHRRLAAAAGLPIPPERFDLRSELLQLGHTQIGGIEACAGRLGAQAIPAIGTGRAGRRLGTLRGIVDVLAPTLR